ncbi:hypothetical protein C8R32_102156 [Nitrosospira sp. Nsp5]|uniref:Uncharacterized protein n=1 Tax=Nitrosospira multiformis TaxID=1231 RepID=A0ABY0TKP2_9PROT|nr:hypothetical protein C8R32_102156 [Nitrosospira sp. Nsp5]SDQ98165.1 hypothetical protein SAMN05216402_3102 [Nitrosospira multiformis]
MEIIDNINHLLGNNLKQTFKPGSKLKTTLRFGPHSLHSRVQASSARLVEPMAGSHDLLPIISYMVQ